MPAGSRVVRVRLNGGDDVTPIDFLAAGLVDMTDGRLGYVVKCLDECRRALKNRDQYRFLSELDAACSGLTDVRADAERYLQRAAVKEVETKSKRGPTAAELRRVPRR